MNILIRKALTLSLYTLLIAFITPCLLLADQNTLTLSGNVTAVTRESGPGYQIETMSIEVNGSSFSFYCANGQGCFDPYWLGPCSPTLNIAKGDPGTTFSTYHCAPSYYRPGRCVTVDGYLLSGFGPNSGIPSRSAIYGLSIVPTLISGGYGCNW